MKFTQPVILSAAKNDIHQAYFRLIVPAFLALCSLLLAPCSAPATELTDLGAGLSYLRVHELAVSVKAAAAPGALVLDLRYATADAAAADDLQAALSRRPADSPLFLLVSPATPATLVPVIRQSRALTLGAPGSLPAPTIVVRTDAASDRRAYDALEAGTSLKKLVSGKVEKERYDEAALVEEFNNGYYHDDAPAPPPDPTAPKPDGGPAKPEVLTDRVLQRAVHLHQAQLALKR